jgi:hypothetical protein
MHEQDEIGAEGAIDHELTAPMTVDVLLAEQVLLRSPHRVGNARIDLGLWTNGNSTCAR